MVLPSEENACTTKAVLNSPKMVELFHRIWPFVLFLDHPCIDVSMKVKTSPAEMHVPSGLKLKEAVARQSCQARDSDYLASGLVAPH